MLTDQKFLADSMLKRMCKWLRIMGYDIQYSGEEMKDREILEKCRKENLILLTRDYELYNRFENSIFVDEIIYQRQVSDFIGRFPPDRSKFFTRCPECNGLLETIKSEKVSDKIPPGIVQKFETVFRCTNCGKFYWEGTHYLKITKQISEIVEGA